MGFANLPTIMMSMEGFIIDFCYTLPFERDQYFNTRRPFLRDLAMQGSKRMGGSNEKAMRSKTKMNCLGAGWDYKTISSYTKKAHTSLCSDLTIIMLKHAVERSHRQDIGRIEERYTSTDEDTSRCATYALR